MVFLLGILAYYTAKQEQRVSDIEQENIKLQLALIELNESYDIIAKNALSTTKLLLTHIEQYNIDSGRDLLPRKRYDNYEI